MNHYVWQHENWTNFRWDTNLLLTPLGEWRQHSHIALSERQKKVINRLLDAGKGGFEGGLTNRKYASMTDVSRATAFRELEALRDMGVIMKSGGGRSVRYELMWREEKVTL